MSEPQLSESEKVNNFNTDQQEISQPNDSPDSVVPGKHNQNSLSEYSKQAQPFSSVDQNRTESKNQDFEEGPPKHPHQLHIAKISSSENVMDSPVQPNYHKAHSQKEETNQEEQSIDLASNEAQADQSKRDLSISQSEGFTTSKFNEQPKSDLPETQPTHQAQDIVPEASKDSFGKNKKQADDHAQQGQQMNKEQQNEDDEFGDFQQTAQNSTQKQENPPQQKPQNIVKINEAYLESSQGPAYKQKQIKLQALVDKLDDYSAFLLQADYQP